ncbi:MAG TPA: DegQ family serine endoprotease [Gammaproteobacteria bacterium]|jgi:Do/DeqQ family serine protease
MRSKLLAWTGCGALLALTVTPAFAQWPFGAGVSEQPTLAPLLREVTPAVVNISVESQRAVGVSPLLSDPFFGRFFDFPQEPQYVPQQSAGSGVIIDAEAGYVLTNHHVIDGADVVRVTLSDKRQVEAEIIGSDAGTDIALLRIEADDLTDVELGDSDALEVGDFVVAIGNPFGLGQTVTSGIVSALGRNGLNADGYEDFIQTDASINPGNSGGALINLDGQLVGINTAIIAPGGGNIGIGFAVPTNMAREVKNQLLEHGEVRRGRLGILIQDLTPAIADALELDAEQGAVVTQVEPDSPAERAGLEPGDVIIEIDGAAVEGSSDLRNKVGLMRLGSTAELVYLRNGIRESVEATIGRASGLTADAGQTIEKLQGAEFRALDSTHPQYGRVQGVLVSLVDQGSPAARNGLRAGDVITAVNRRPVQTVEQLSQAIRQASGAMALNVVRNNMRLFIVIQ